MDMRTFAATHPAIRVDESSDWVKILRVERDFDIHENAPYSTHGYTLTMTRNTGEIRYTVMDDRSISPVGSLVYYLDDQGKGCLRVEGRRGDVIASRVHAAREGLDRLGEYVKWADRAAQ